MRELLCAAVAVSCLAAAPSAAWAQKAVFVVRHAEKADESEDPPLSAEGRMRSEALARLLRSAGITAVYVTQYERTGLTAAPLARALGVTPVAMHSDSSQELVDRIRREHANDVVLVVGHSGSVPQVVTLLGHPDPVNIGHDEYDSLFVVAPRASGPPTVLRLQYGQ